MRHDLGKAAVYDDLAQIHPLHAYLRREVIRQRLGGNEA